MTGPLLDVELERRILSCPGLPTLPAVALEVLRLCQAEDLDLWRIADALGSDPALASRVLRVANGASLAARSRVATLSRAVLLLGANGVLSVALSFALLRGRRRGEFQGLDHSRFWRRAVFAALAARALAEEEGTGAEPEEAFVAALLQDLGMLALAEVFGPEYGPLLAAAAGDHGALAEREREAWGTDHCAVSALLMRTWRLPVRQVAAVLASHDQPCRAGDGPERALARCVSCSGPVADLWIGPAVTELEGAAEATGLDGAALSRVMERMALVVPETAADFDIQLGSPERVEEVLAEARRLRGALGLTPLAEVVPLPGEASPGPGPRFERGDALLAAIRAAHARARDRGEPLALLLAAADRVSVATLVGILRRRLRSGDILGEEIPGAATLLVLLPRTDPAAAAAVAGLLRHAAAAGGVPGLAVGGATLGAGAPVMPLARLLATAAAALLAALAQGGAVVFGADGAGAA